MAHDPAGARIEQTPRALDAPPAAAGTTRVVRGRPDDGLTRPLSGDRYCRVTVILPGGGRVTASLPLRVPLVEVADLVVRDLPLGDVMLPPVWTLGEVGRPAIAPMATLAEAGVLDGAVLEIRDAEADEVGEPLVLDVVEMVHDAEDRDGHGRWTPAAAAALLERAGYVLAAIAALAGLSVPARDDDRAVIGLAAAVVGLVLLAAGNLRHRGPRPSRTDAVLAAWCAIAVLGVAARCSASTGDPWPRTGAGVALACLLACAAVPGLLVIGPAIAVAVTAVTAAVLTGTGADAAQSAAVAGTMGVLLVALTPAVAGRLGALVPETGDAAAGGAGGAGGAGAGGAADRLPIGIRIPAVRRSAVQARWERTMRSRIALAVRQVHVVFVVACIVGAGAVVAAAFVLARASSIYPTVLAPVLAVAVLLRAVPARRATDGGVLLVGGGAALLVVLAVLPGRWWPVWVGPVLALAVVLLAVTAGLARPAAHPDADGGPTATPATTPAVSPRTTEPGVVRAARIGSVVLLVAAVVLTVGGFGVFDHFLHVGRSL